MMKILSVKYWSLFTFLLAVSLHSAAQVARSVTDISESKWLLTLDTAAQWENDLLMPPGQVKIGSLPVKAPTRGWSSLEGKSAIPVTLPATVEEYFWGRNGNSFGVSGNYLGVSWFSTKLMVPATFKGKRIALSFESVRFRAEVFVNQKLVGYDLVNSTPFEVDITDAVQLGKVNNIAIRITDPNGNFDWRDSQNFMWGDYRTQPTHGFGGITGKVKLIATGLQYISDIFVKNKPNVHEITVQVTAVNQRNTESKGVYYLQITDNATKKVVYAKDYPVSLLAGDNVNAFDVKLTGAKLWDVDHPNLYTATVKWEGANASADSYSKRFGFRWFEVRNIGHDKQFYLNGKRIVVRTSISWGFWPGNGIAPSDALARKQVMDAKRLGLNMLNFHRTIGQTNVLDAADELGLLYFEEPGGNQFPENLYQPKNDLERKQRDFYIAVRNEKFFRMIKRDRSHPSLVIYNMHNERGAQPQQADREQMLAGQRLDNSRIMTYNSSNGPIKEKESDPRFKLHLLPYDTTFYDYGWFDQHHAGGPGVYHDNLYNNPKSYAKYTDHEDEIIYYGEEGAIGTPPRLQLIRDEILKEGINKGWETAAYLKWYTAYDEFLKKNGFSKAFPNVDSLTRKMGNVAYYYQGRVIENVRLNNTIDGYAVNGWESMKLENHSGVVDNYRNLKGDPDLIARYNKPLFVAVKLRRKVLAAGDSSSADFYLVNEKNITGNAQLDIRLVDSKGKVKLFKSVPVVIKGGNTYGQLLLENFNFPVEDAGYTTLKASLIQHGKPVCIGDDQLFAVKLTPPVKSQTIAVADTTHQMQRFLKDAGLKDIRDYRSGRPEAGTSILVVSNYDPQQTGNPLVTDILEWVNSGNKLIIVGNIEKWCTHLAKKEVIDFRGIQPLGTSWYGGNYFAKENALFNGLPQSGVFNWEYQTFAAYNKLRLGMRIMNGETLVGCVSDHKPEVYSALSVIPHGRGQIIICALDILSTLKNNTLVKRAEGDGENAAMTTFNPNARNPANVVAWQLLFNLLK
jgi:beta-galactosidase